MIGLKHFMWMLKESEKISNELQNRLDRIDEVINERIDENNEKELMMIRQILKGESH